MLHKSATRRNLLPSPRHKARPPPPRYRRHRCKRVEIAYNPACLRASSCSHNRVDASRDIKKKLSFRISIGILPRRMEIFSDGKKCFGENIYSIFIFRTNHFIFTQSSLVLNSKYQKDVEVTHDISSIEQRRIFHGEKIETK